MIRHHKILSSFYALLLFAPLLFNHQPLYINYQGKHYLPFLFPYSEQELGGKRLTQINFSDPQIQHLIKPYTKVTAPYPHDGTSIDQHTSHALQAPSQSHWLGTNSAGQDILAYSMFAIRHDLFLCLILCTISLSLGTIIGTAIGYLGGNYDLIGQRVIEIAKSIPLTYLMIIAHTSHHPMPCFFILYTLTQWTKTASTARIEAIQIRGQPYIQDARCAGLSHRFIIQHHMLCHIRPLVERLSPYLIISTLGAINTLDYLGISVTGLQPSLGKLTYEAKCHPEAIWILLACFASYSVVILSLVYIQQTYQIKRAT
tara:strand:+ start:673 stop:1617 length:945 start_codon:yes stop_codon:yes gene_type:complete